MRLSWDPTTARIVIEAYPLAEVDADDDGFLEDDDDTDAAEVLRVRMRPALPGPSRSARGRSWAPGVQSA